MNGGPVWFKPGSPGALAGPGAPALSKLPVHTCFECACQKIRAESDSDRGPIPGGPGAMKGSMLRI
jgi:hypothetical protein